MTAVRGADQAEPAPPTAGWRRASSRRAAARLRDRRPLLRHWPPCA